MTDQRDGDDRDERVEAALRKLTGLGVRCPNGKPADECRPDRTCPVPWCQELE